MSLDKEHQNLANNNNVITEDTAVDELDIYEENEEMYKWLSLLLVIIWAVSMIFF